MLKKFFRSSKGKTSIEVVLGRLFTSHEYQALLAQTPDRRMLVEHAAERLNVSEESLVTTIGEMLNIPVTFNILSVPFHELIFLPPIESFYSAGAFPIVNGRSLVGIVSSDPARAILALGIKEKITFHLSTWKRIKSSLDESRLAFELRKEKRKEEERIRLQKTSEAIVGLIIEEAEAFGSAQATIVFSDQDIEYYFCNEEDKKAKGSIDKRIETPFKSVLKTAIDSKEISVRLSDENYRHGVTANVTSDSPLTINLEWQSNKDTLKPSNLIPFPGANSIDSVKDEEKTETDSLIPQQVLLIDDNETFAKVLDRFLERYKIQCKWMADASKAFSVLENGSLTPGAIICDVHMPGMNGFEFLSKLRSNEKFRSIPIIMLTSDSDIETELSLLSRGADVFIGKTQDPRLLCIHVKRLLDKSGTKEAA